MLLSLAKLTRRLEVYSGPFSGSAAACQWTTVTAFVVLLRVAGSLLLLASEAAGAAVRPPLRLAL